MRLYSWIHIWLLTQTCESIHAYTPTHTRISLQSQISTRTVQETYISSKIKMMCFLSRRQNLNLRRTMYSNWHWKSISSSTESSLIFLMCAIYIKRRLIGYWSAVALQEPFYLHFREQLRVHLGLLLSLISSHQWPMLHHLLFCWRNQ